ncbi:MAG: branched-chain amino acid transport system ATP-binding protein livF [Acidimicrobiaceae bacterium]
MTVVGDDTALEPAAPTPLLTVEAIDASYGPLQVLFGVDLVVPEHGRVALLGTNGAGKSTVFRVVSGLMTPDAGCVRFAGEDVTSLPPHERVARGMTLVEGGRAVFPGLTVTENLRVGSYPFLSDKRRVAAGIDRTLDLFPALRGKLDQPAGTLSGGEQQMLAMGRALLPEPRLLMIDELSLGLAPVVLQDLVAVLDALATTGTTLLLVEQSLNVALRVADQAYFMEKGEVRFSGPAAELLDRGDLVRSVFFGGRE